MQSNVCTSIESLRYCLQWFFDLKNILIKHFCFLKTQENLIGNVQKVHDILQETTDVTDDTSDILTTSSGKTFSEKLSTNRGEKTVSENMITESSEVWENTGRSMPPFSAQSTRQTVPVEQVQNGAKMRSLPRCALLLIVFVSLCLSNFDISTFLR
jgi:hypothetical protein